MLEYKLPDLGKNSDFFRTMHPDDLFRIRNEVKHHLTLIQEAAQEALDGNITSICDICSKYGYAYMDVPAKWGWVQSTLICDDCVKRWEQRFGETPVLNREGDIVYEQDSSVSENPTHRGQATFDFI